MCVVEAVMEGAIQKTAGKNEFGIPKAEEQSGWLQTLFPESVHPLHTSIPV